MAELEQSGSGQIVLLVAARNTPVASRMAMRFARAGCQVAALHSAKAHLLASTQTVTRHFHYSAIDPIESLLGALSESGAHLVVPCDGLAVRHLHSVYAALPSTPEAGAIAEVIERSLGDPTAYLVIDSRHEVQTAARAEGLNAAESFAIGRTTDPETLAQSLPFPWVMKADYSWGGRGVRIVHSLSEARAFDRVAGSPPSLGMAMKQLFINKDRAALGEWMHAKRTGLSAQKPLTGRPANAAVACWRGSVLAHIAVEVISPSGLVRPPAVVRVIENEQITQTVRRMTDRLGLSGFHSFDFMLDPESGQAALIEFNSHCTGLTHINAGPGRDLVEAFYRKWTNTAPAQAQPPHPGLVIAYFPQAWVADADDPVLKTDAYDVPKEDPVFVERAMAKVQRDRRYVGLRSKVDAITGRSER